MSAQRITLDIVCGSCDGTGLYVGMGERDGAAVVCTRCKGAGRQAYTYEPFTERKPASDTITRVHVGRGYVLGDHPNCDGGMPVSEYEPGMTVPADEKLYCPYQYTNQGWCAKPEIMWGGGKPQAPLLSGYISDCKHWAIKAECWAIFRESAPDNVKRQVS